MSPTHQAARPAYWADACAALSEADPVLAELIGRYPDAQLHSRGEPFVTLVRAIVGQQISTRAADAVWGRLQAAVPALSPQALLAVPEVALRDAGLSGRKVEYTRDLARHFADGLLDPDSFARMDDQALIDALVAVRGIGRWSAEMFLIFNQLRADVWPVDDIGLQRAVGRHYLHGISPTPKALRQFGQRFAPWRTVATWYLWRSLDPETVLY
jgi:DNA-3-methyladenine glycosylase II